MSESGMPTTPVAFVTGTPAWSDQAVAILREAGFSVAHFPDLSRANHADYLKTLIDSWAALVVVDGARPDWQSWVTAIKATQAARRIPVLVVADAPAVIAQAPLAGVGVVIAPDDLASALADQARALARITDPAFAAEMDCQCAETLPPLAHEAVLLFNAGNYYRQHDLFEEQWLAESGPVRELYRAVLQVGVAYYHLTRSNHRGAVKMLRRSVQWFALLPDVCQGIDVRQLREDAARVRAVLEVMDPADIDTFDRSLLKPVRLIADS